LSTFTEAQIRARARQRTTYATASVVLNEAVKSASTTQTFDIFLSHSVRDAEIVLGVKLLLEDLGKTVYVDWLDDPQLDRSRVTPGTAEKIRARMRQSRSLVYIHTENSSVSKWMPWELGFSDALHGAVAILPVTRTADQSFHGQEYLGIYPWIDQVATLGGLPELRIHKSQFSYKTWYGWMASPREMRMAS
jgi:hypothetical protein